MKDKNMCNSKRQTSIENLVVKTKKREGGRSHPREYGVWGIHAALMSQTKYIFPPSPIACLSDHLGE